MTSLLFFSHAMLQCHACVASMAC